MRDDQSEEGIGMGASRKPYISVTLDGPDDGGDFGPHTPGTRTSGIQEAMDFAHAHCRDLYIHGGRGGLHRGEGIADNVYHLDETLRVPWSQDFILGGGNYLLNYRKDTGHAIQIDSQMNCRYKFGLVVSQSPQAAVCIQPRTPGPDDFVVVTASLFDFACVVSGHPEGIGILLDSTRGPIVNSKLFAEEANTQGIGVYLTDAGGAGQWLSNNQIQVLYGNQYHATGEATGLRLGDPGSQKIVHNRLDLSLHAPRGAHFDSLTRRYVTVEDFVSPDAVGARIHAQRNLLSLAFFGPRAPGHDLVFEPDARDNTLFVYDLPNGITNRATLPTNRVVPNWPVGFAVPTPPVPASGEWVTNTTSLTVQILVLSPGQVSEWILADAGSTPPAVPRNLSLIDNRGPAPLPPDQPPAWQTVAGGLFAGQCLVLEPGERISFTYTQTPTWRWKALR
jgi:hypothetical protein